MSRVFHWVACVEAGIPVAICLEHDLVTQTESIDDIHVACVEILIAHAAASAEEGLDPWTLQPPPEEAVLEFREAPGAFELEVTLP
jgi:hypothetical protein